MSERPTSFVDVDLVNQPATFENYRILRDDLPALFIGFQIKNKYDEERLYIPEKYEPQRILQLCYNANSEVKARTLYGIFVKPKPIANKLMGVLDELTDQMNILSTNAYQTLLRNHGVACDDAYAYMFLGLYPIDLSFYKDLCYYSKFDLKTFIDPKNFQSIAALNIYVLGNHMVYAHAAYDEILKQARIYE